MSPTGCWQRHSVASDTSAAVTGAVPAACL